MYVISIFDWCLCEVCGRTLACLSFMWNAWRHSRRTVQKVWCGFTQPMLFYHILRKLNTEVNYEYWNLFVTKLRFFSFEKFAESISVQLRTRCSSCPLLLGMHITVENGCWGNSVAFYQLFHWWHLSIQLFIIVFELKAFLNNVTTKD